MLWRRETDSVGLGCVDSGDNVSIVLKFVKMRIGRGAGIREGIREERVVWTIGKGVDDVREVEVWWCWLAYVLPFVVEYLLAIMI